MPQIFQVLRCYKCFIFQIHQTKKSNKWECKMCGEKQSIKRHYGIGTGKECRMHVQKLNKMQAEKTNMPKIEIDEEEEDEEEEVENKLKMSNTLNNKINNSKWSNYISESKEKQETNEPMYLNDQEVVLEIPKKPRLVKRKINRQRYLDNHYPDSMNLDNVCNEEKIKTQELSCSGLSEKNIKNPIYNNSTSFQKIKSATVNSETKAPIQCLVDIEKNSYENQSNAACVSNTLITKTKHKSNSLKKVAEAPDKVKNSKWAQYIEIDDSVIINDDIVSNIEDSEVYSSQMNVAAVKEFSQSLLNLDDSCESQNINKNLDTKIPIQENKITKTKQGNKSLFSMVDEDDLDSILDF
ncbi:unnamed protein product [Colias eurytheme]|nr:unnamed protein product [Colias eurytheme]